MNLWVQLLIMTHLITTTNNEKSWHLNQRALAWNIYEKTEKTKVCLFLQTKLTGLCNYINSDHRVKWSVSRWRLLCWLALLKGCTTLDVSLALVHFIHCTDGNFLSAMKPNQTKFLVAVIILTFAQTQSTSLNVTDAKGAGAVATKRRCHAALQLAARLRQKWWRWRCWWAFSLKKVKEMLGRKCNERQKLVLVTVSKHKLPARFVITSCCGQLMLLMGVWKVTGSNAKIGKLCRKLRSRHWFVFGTY